MDPGVLKTAVLLHKACDKDMGGIGKEWKEVIRVSAALKHPRTQCNGDSCLCLDLQACLQLLLAKAAQQQPELSVLVQMLVHSFLTKYAINAASIEACPHVAATQLAFAEVYYK
jgi:hypothetical protein